MMKLAGYSEAAGKLMDIVQSISSKQKQMASKGFGELSPGKENGAPLQNLETYFKNTSKGIEYLKKDESRHIAYGIYLINSLLESDKRRWSAVEETTSNLFPLVQQVFDSIFVRYEQMPFNLKKQIFIDYALLQSQKRLNKLQQSVTDKNRISTSLQYTFQLVQNSRIFRFAKARCQKLVSIRSSEVE